MSRTNPRYHRVNPPMLPITGGQGAIRYKIIGAIEGQLTVSSFDYIGPVANPTTGQINTLEAAISAAVFGVYKACISADWSCTKERMDVIHRNDIVGGDYLANAGAVGGRAAGHEPTEVAQPLIKRTTLKGQHGRGRLSLPAIATADVTASKITAAAEITALNALITGMLTNVSDGANNWSPAITTRSLVPPKVAVGYEYVTAMSISPLLGTIRRRKIGRGK